MNYVLLGIIIALLAYLIVNKRPTKKEKSPRPKLEKKSKELTIKGAYQKRWVFTMNEKEAYRKLKAICDEKGLTLLAKVRLLDLVEPVTGQYNYKTYLYKIQAKHVDFVICDEKLVARYIVELDDSSHDTEKRQERDRLVDEIMESVGYKIIHTRAVTDDLKGQLNEAHTTPYHK